MAQWYAQKETELTSDCLNEHQAIMQDWPITSPRPRDRRSLSRPNPQGLLLDMGARFR